MAAVSETIVRECFELHGFLVRQQRKYVARTQREHDEVDFLVWNPQPQNPGAPLPFILDTEHLPCLERAIVVVKGWHTETFSPAILTSQPKTFRSISPSALRQAANALGGSSPILRILVVPALPSGAEGRDQSIALLKSRGVDAVLPFAAVLADLIRLVEVTRNYEKSDLLQMLRILKNYDFFREPQLELFKPRTRTASRPGRQQPQQPEALPN